MARDRSQPNAKRKPGRPPRAGEATAHQVNVRLTEQEMARWEIAAAGAGCTLVDWIRLICNEAAQR